MEREDFIKKWLEGKISSDDLDKKLHDNREMRDLKDIISKSTELRVPQKRTKAEAWKQFAEKAEAQKQVGKVVKMKPWFPLSIAASVLFLALYVIFFSSDVMKAPRGKQVTHTLPDGSQVWLNADSKISFRSFDLNETRKISLRGEAFFEVKKGGAFIVEVDGGTITVLGTSFNISQRSSALEVSCFSGSVQVTSKHQKVILKAGEFTQTKATNELTDPTIFDADKAASWRKGEFYFESTPLENVISELERQFDIDIRYTGKIGREYTGYFTNKDLNEALQLVFHPMKLPYRREGKTVIVE